MPDWYSVIAAEWKTLAVVTLVEIDSTKFYTVVQSLKQNVVSEAIKALGGDATRVAPPYLIQQIGTDKVATDAGPDGRYYRLGSRWYFLIDKSPDATLDTPAYCRSRLEVLRVALQLPGNLTTCSWMGDDGEIDSSEDVAFADQNLNLFAAELTFENGFLTRLT